MRQTTEPTAGATRGRHRTQRPSKTTHWLEAGAVGLGIGAAALVSAGAAHASDGTDSTASATDTKTGPSAADAQKKSASVSKAGDTSAQQSVATAKKSDGKTGQETTTDLKQTTTTVSKDTVKEPDSGDDADDTADSAQTAKTGAGADDEEAAAKPVAATAKKSASSSSSAAKKSTTDEPGTVSTVPDKKAAVVSVATTSAKTTTQTTEATPKAATTAATAAAAPDPFADLGKWIQRTFFNQSPTVSYNSADNKTLANGSIQGTVRGLDADGDTLTYSASVTKAGGSVTIDDTGKFTYVPVKGSTTPAADSFTVSVNDDAPENGWHIHGFWGLFSPGFGSTAATEVALTLKGTTNPGGGGTTNPGGGGTTNPGDGQTAAAKYGWDNPKETQFTSAAEMAGSGWAVYNSPGHAGYGRRTPAAISFADGVMTITGDSAGNTGGMAWMPGQQYGAWEVRIQTPAGATDYAPVALLWPDAENWPSGGELDFFELVGDGARQKVSYFLHYSAQNRQLYGATNVDATQWHNYAVSWTPQAINYYIDGNAVFTVTDTSKFPPGKMHMTLQLDAVEKRPINLSGGAKMNVAWARQYTLAGIS